MILIAFTLFHVLISLVGIGTDFVVLYGLLNSQRMDGWTFWFLLTTVATSVTGFMFPVHEFMPSHGVGILSLIILGFSILARYKYNLEGGWRKVYVYTAVTALYFNVFVLIAQSFAKVPALKELAPTQSEPPFAVAQLLNLLIFAFLAVRAAKRFQVSSMRAA